MAKLTIAIILAAGYSSRMGDLKALLPFRETTLIEKQIKCFRDAGIDEVIVVTGHRHEEIEDVLNRSQVRIVYNPNYPEGMFSSLKAGLKAIIPDSCDAFLFLPVDYPLIRPYMIRLLVQTYLAQNKNLAYLRFNGKKGHPPMLSASWIDPILAYTGEYGIKGLIKPFDDQAAYVELPNNECILNMNTLEDYFGIIEIDRHKTHPDPFESELIIRSYPEHSDIDKIMAENGFMK